VCPGRGGTGSYDRHGRSRRADAFTYDDDLVPGDSHCLGSVGHHGSGQSIVTPIVHGLLPNHTYGAHAHVNACRSTGAAAGGHVEQSATGGANPENEIWLDFTTRDEGSGEAIAVHHCSFTGTQRPRSIVIHRDETGS